MKKKLYYKLRGLVGILRPVNLIIIAISFLFGCYFLKTEINIDTIYLIIIYMAIAGLGNLYNDILDLEVDKVNVPHRPLPSGLISLKLAWWYGILIFVLISILNTLLFDKLWLFLFNWSTFILTMLYSLLIKRTGLRGNLLVAYLTATPFFALCIYYTNFMSLKNIIVFAFFIILIREIVKDLEDYEGDKLIDSQSLPLRLGVAKTKSIILGLTLLYFGITMFLGIYYDNRLYYFIVVGFFVNMVNFASYYFTSIGKYNKASLLLKLNIFIGMIGLWLSK